MLNKNFLHFQSKEKKLYNKTSGVLFFSHAWMTEDVPTGGAGVRAGLQVGGGSSSLLCAEGGAELKGSTGSCVMFRS